MLFNTSISNDVGEAIKWLSMNELVAIPTETVYGLAANALNADACLKIFEAKNRPTFDPLIVHIKSITEVEKYAFWHNETLKQLAQHFWPGPLTILLPKSSIIPDIVTSGLQNVALRVPNHPVTLDILHQLNFPLAAPSANPFGYISPTTPQHVYQQLKGTIPFIVDGGSCNVGIESTIVGYENNECVVYRLGGISIEAIEQVIGKVVVQNHSSSNPQSPGLLKSHYAPKKTFLLGDISSLVKAHSHKKLGVISFYKKAEGNNILNIILSDDADLHEAAKKLFATMRKLDDENIDMIICELMPNEGLGRAMNDRLKRAAADFE